MVSAKFRVVVESVRSIADLNMRGVGMHSKQNRLDSILKRALSSDFFRKVFLTFATRIITIALGLISTILIARILGPEGRGLYAVAAAVGAIGVQFGNLGLHASNTHYVAKDPNLLPQLLGNSLIVSFVLGGLGSFVAWLVFITFPQLAPVEGHLLKIALTYIPIGLAYLLLQNLVLGIQEIRFYNLIELSGRVIGVALVVVAVLVGVTSVEVLYAMGLLSLILGVGLVLIRLNSQISNWPRVSADLFRENLRYGVKAYFAAVFAFIVLKIDLLMVQYILGSTQTGYYSIAVAMAEMVYMLPVVIGTILFPRLSAMKDVTKRWRETKYISISVGVIMSFCGCLLVLVAAPIVELMFGATFLPSVPAFLWLMPGIVFLSINTILMNYFASMGMPMLVVYSPLVAAISNICLNIWMIPSYGIIGASISSVIAYGMMLLSSIIFIYVVGSRYKYGL